MSEGRVTVFQVSCAGSDDDGKWGLVGTAVVGHRSKGEERVYDGNSEGEEASGDPGDSAADGPEI